MTRFISSLTSFIRFLYPLISVEPTGINHLGGT